MLVTLFALGRPLLFGQLSDAGKYWKIFSIDDFHNNASPTDPKCNNEDPGCHWDEEAKGFKCTKIQDNNNPNDDKCFGYFEYTRQNPSNDEDYITEFEFRCQLTGGGRCFFDVSTPSGISFQKYINANQQDGWVSMYENNDGKPYKGDIKVRVYLHPYSTNTVFQNVSIIPINALAVENIPNYEESNTRTERLPTGKKTPIQTKNGLTAYRASIKLYKENEKIQGLSTKVLYNSFPIPKMYIKISLDLTESKEPKLLSPIIANSQYIVGVDIFKKDFFIDWNLKLIYEQNKPESSSLYLNIKPLEDIEISYIVIEASSKSYVEALEIWHKAFPEFYGVNPYGKASIALNANTTDWAGHESDIVNKYGGKLIWDSSTPETAVNETLNFNEIDPSFIKITQTNNIATFDQDCPDTAEECKLVKKYGIRNTSGALNAIKENDYLLCPVILSDEVITYQLKNYYEKKSKNCYDGVAIRNFDLTYASYGLSHDIIKTVSPYVLYTTSDSKEYINSYCGMFKIMNKLQKDSPKGFIVESHVVYPQSTQFIGSVIYKHQREQQYSIFSQLNKVRLWNLRFSLGSKVISLMDELGSDLREDWMCTAPAIGAMVTGIKYRGAENIWKNYTWLYTYLDGSYNRYGTLFKNIFEGATFMANGDGRVEDNPFAYFGVYCKNDGSSCYANFVQSKNPNTKYIIKMKDPDASCYLKQGDGVSCTKLDDGRFEVSSTAQFRSIIIKFKGEVIQQVPETNVYAETCANKRTSGNEGTGGKEESGGKEGEGTSGSDGNGTTGNPSDNKENDADKDKSDKKSIIIGVVCGVLGVAIIVILVILILHRKKHTKSKADRTKLEDSDKVAQEV